jgi:hypothetical protein
VSEPVVFLPLLEARAIVGGRRDGDRLASDAHRFSWQREMEKAEAQSWFKVEKPSDATSTTSASTGHDATPPMETSSRLPGPRQARADAASARSASVQPPPAAGAPGLDAEAARSVDRTRPTGHANAGADQGLREGSALTNKGGVSPIGEPVDAEATLDASQPVRSPLSTTARVVDLESATVSPETSAPTGIANGSQGSTTVPALPGAAAGRALPAGSPIDIASSSVPLRESESLPASKVAATERLSAAISRALDPLPPVRLHVEWSSASAKVWIGLDSAADVHLPTLVGSLARWLDRAGVKLRSVTCNGEVCYSDHSLPPLSLENGAEVSSNGSRRLGPTLVDITLNQEK